MDNSILSDLLLPDDTHLNKYDIRSADDMGAYLAHILEDPTALEFNDGLFLDGVYGSGDKDRPKLSPSEWSLKYRLFKGKPMSFHNFPYQPQILDDMHPKQVIKKSAQMGISEIMLTKLFWFGDYNMGKAIYTFPTYADMLSYAASRLPSIIEGSTLITPDDEGWDMKYVADPITYIESMLVVNNAKMRRIKDFFIYYKGTFGDNSAISVDSDWNIHDEVNFSNASVLNKFKSRLGASDMAWEYNFSTPTIPGFGVSPMYQKSDMHVWEIKCPHCNKQYKMDFDRHVKELAFGKGYIFQCHGCQNEITPETRRSGIWIPQSPDVKDLRGYHISKMMNPRTTAKQLVDSKEGYRRVADFYNFDLGEDYSEKSTSLTLEMLQDLERPYKMWGSAKPEHNVVMGIDQGDVLWITLSVPDITQKDGEKIIYMESVDAKDYDDEDPFQRIPELWERYSVQYAVLDANPNKNSSRWLKNKYPKKFFMAFYTSTRDGDINIREEDGVVNIDRTEMFKGLFNDVATGVIKTPKGFEITEVFNKHHTSLKKETIEDDDTGERKEFFVRTGHDHFAHANLYRKVARMIQKELQPDTGNTVAVTKSGGGHWSGRSGYARKAGEKPARKPLGVIPRTIR